MAREKGRRGRLERPKRVEGQPLYRAKPPGETFEKVHQHAFWVDDPEVAFATAVRLEQLVDTRRLVEFSFSTWIHRLDDLRDRYEVFRVDSCHGFAHLHLRDDRNRPIRDEMSVPFHLREDLDLARTWAQQYTKERLRAAADDDRLGEVKQWKTMWQLDSKRAL